MEKRILTGWKRQKEDLRDYKYKLDPTLELPSSASVEKYLPAPRDQKNIGACVSFAVTGAIECLEKKNKVELPLRKRRGFLLHPLNHCS
jgi:hypothetical protein